MLGWHNFDLTINPLNDLEVRACDSAPAPPPSPSLGRKSVSLPQPSCVAGRFPQTIEEGRTTSKSPHYKLQFLSMYQQAVTADIIPNSAVGIFSLKTEGTKT
jgi:hypothetical protein